MKQVILVDKIEIVHKRNPLFDEESILGIKVHLRKDGCASALYGAVSRHYDGISTENLALTLDDWKEELLKWDRKVRYGRRRKKP